MTNMYDWRGSTIQIFIGMPGNIVIIVIFVILDMIAI